MIFVIVFGNEDMNIEPDVVGPFETHDAADEFIERLEATTTWANKGVSVDSFRATDPAAYTL